MKTAQHSIDIVGTPGAVFDFMLDARYAPEWRDLITRLEWLDGEPRAGARLRLHFWAEGKEEVQDARLVEYDRPRRYVIENHNRGYRARFVNCVDALGAGTRVTITVDVSGDSVWGTLLLPLMRARHHARLQRTLQRLKTAVEKVR